MIAIAANMTWTFDDVIDVRDSVGLSWAQNVTENAQFEPASPYNGGIWLDTNKTLVLPGDASNANRSCLNVPCAVFTLSVWFKYFGDERRVLLGAGDDHLRSTGVFIGINGTNHVTLQVSHRERTCSITFYSPKNVWTHIALSWQNSILLLRNGQTVDAPEQCTLQQRQPSVGNDVILSGNASFDDLLVWNTNLDISTLYKLYAFYKGERT